MIWLAALTIVLTWLVMFKTPIGLRIRAVGEHPRAADTVGISVYKIRYASVVLSGILAALGGAYLSIGFLNSFNQNMTAGTRVHRACRGHLRQLAPVGSGGGGAPLWLLERPRAAVAGVLGVGRRPLPGAPVRAHPDRGRRSHRPLDPAGSRWPSLQEAVTADRRAPVARACPSSSACSRLRCCPPRSWRRAGRRATSSWTPRSRFPWRRALASSPGRSRAARVHASHRRSATRKEVGPPGSAGSSGCSDSCSR